MSAGELKKIRVEDYNASTNSLEKYVYTTAADLIKYTTEKKKMRDNEKRRHVFFRKFVGHRIFVSNLFHKKRKTKFLKKFSFIQKVDARSTIAIKIDLEYVYEYDFAKRSFMVGPKRDEFILPKWRFPAEEIPFVYVI